MSLVGVIFMKRDKVTFVPGTVAIHNITACTSCRVTTYPQSKFEKCCLSMHPTTDVSIQEQRLYQNLSTTSQTHYSRLAFSDPRHNSYLKCCLRVWARCQTRQFVCEKPGESVVQIPQGQPRMVADLQLLAN